MEFRRVVNEHTRNMTSDQRLNVRRRIAEEIPAPREQ
jgi:hypothetical protein